jgi:two-component system cell cycle sensor histidine kinase PleC
MRTATRRTADAPKADGTVDAPLDVSALQSAIFNSATFSSIATDAKGVIQIFNVGAERMLGYAADEVLDRITPADISDPDEVIARAAALSLELGTPIAPGFEALVFKASRGIEDVYELTYVRKDGSRFPAIVSVTALRDTADVIIGYLLIGTDNTARKAIEDERKTLELALRQKNAELETASRMKSEFLANMSHELRTPLNAIIGFSEVLADGLIGELTEKQRGFISDIFSSGKHLLSLINDILDLSKVEAGKMLDLESVQIAPLVTNSLSIVREKASSRRINLTMDATGVGSVQADGRKVKQIVYNLLSNAVKFTADRGDVTLRATRVPRSAVGKIASGKTGRSFPLADSAFEEFLEISVTDNGMGIPPESIDSLFKPFSQIDSGLSRKFEGTGLGLAMVKLLADLHGGAVAVESTLGKGSRFTVWLPVRAPHEVATPPPPPRVFSSSEWGPEAHVALVVEDDQKSADLVRVQLEAEGFQVVHAPTAEQGLILAQQLCRLQAGDAGLTLSVVEPPDAVLVMANAKRFQQIMLNLVTNAIKFTPRRGKVDVICERDNGAVRVRVRDTGIGIAADDQARVFDPFVQVGRTRQSGSEPGIGLGLSISREFARAMSGDITLESSVGKGSVFTLTLPAASAVPALVR